MLFKLRWLSLRQKLSGILKRLSLSLTWELRRRLKTSTGKSNGWAIDFCRGSRGAPAEKPRPDRGVRYRQARLHFWWHHGLVWMSN